MLRKAFHPTPRKGAITPLVAVMLIVLMAFAALAVDLGYVVVVHEQMQAAADSAALAGASQLLDPGILHGTNNLSAAQKAAMANARTQAQSFAHRNSGGGTALTLDANTSNSTSGDIVLGFLQNPSNRTQAMTYSQFPNSCQVRVHRDSVRNGSLSLFFARALGVNTWDLQATATASYQGGITGFKSQTAYSTCTLLPFTMLKSDWDAMVAGSTGDNFTRVTPTASLLPPNNVSSGADGIHEQNLFPLASNLSSGNFDMCDIGPPANGTPVYINWILNGPSASDLAYFNAANGYPNGLKLDPTTGTLILKGTPGVHAAMQTSLQSIIGQPRVIPLYSSVSKNGNNAQYTIVGFGGCTIVDVKLTGSLSTKHVTIQPCFVVDGTAISGGTTPVTSQYIVQSLALTR